MRSDAIESGNCGMDIKSLDRLSVQKLETIVEDLIKSNPTVANEILHSPEFSLLRKKSHKLDQIAKIWNFKKEEL